MKVRTDRRNQAPNSNIVGWHPLLKVRYNTPMVEDRRVYLRNHSEMLKQDRVAIGFPEAKPIEPYQPVDLGHLEQRT